MHFIINQTISKMKEQTLGLIRHVLTFVGGILVTKGLIDDATSLEIVGGIVTIVGAAWSVFSKKTA